MEKEVLKATDDIDPLTVRNFDKYHAILRGLHAELLPQVLAAHYPGGLKSPVKFDHNLAEAIKGEVTVKDLETAVGWYRCVAWLDPRKPQNPPPDGFAMTDQVLRAAPNGYVPDLDAIPPHIEPATAKALACCTTPALQEMAAACEKHRGPVMAALCVSEFENPDVLDLVMQNAMVKYGPEELRSFSEQRPTVFDVLSSVHRYRPALVAMQRKMLVATERGTLSSGDAASKIFDSIAPNSQAIKDEIIRQHVNK